jgi:hypothetical protein
MESRGHVQGVDFVNQSGFWIENNVLSDHECDDLIEAAPLSLQGRSRAGARHLMSIPAIEAAANDERLLRIARRALGDGAIPYRATLFDKSARANWLVVWHQDKALPLESRSDSKEWGPWLAMRPLLVHSSSKLRGAEPRRVLHIEYAEFFDLEPGLRLAIA